MIYYTTQPLPPGRGRSQFTWRERVAQLVVEYLTALVISVRRFERNIISTLSTDFAAWCIMCINIRVVNSYLLTCLLAKWTRASFICMSICFLCLCTLFTKQMQFCMPVSGSIPIGFCVCCMLLAFKFSYQSSNADGFSPTHIYRMSGVKSNFILHTHTPKRT